MTLSSADVARIRERIARAHEIAAIQFRDTFVPGQTDPTTHLQMLADALIGESDGIRLRGPAYEIRNGLIEPRYDNFIVERTPATIFEYWLIISEITGSDAWRMTKLIASVEEYDGALKRMRSPQIVRALVAHLITGLLDLPARSPLARTISATISPVALRPVPMAQIGS